MRNKKMPENFCPEDNYLTPQRALLPRLFALSFLNRMASSRSGYTRSLPHTYPHEYRDTTQTIHNKHAAKQTLVAESQRGEASLDMTEIYQQKSKTNSFQVSPLGASERKHEARAC